MPSLPVEIPASYPSSSPPSCHLLLTPPRDKAVANNALTGPIPTWIGQLPGLQLLGVSYNQLTGGIPSEIGNLANLQFLSMAANELTGEIPSEFGNLVQLAILDVAANRLGGTIPTVLASLPLRYLDLSRNAFQGTIPQDLASLSLAYLYLNENLLTGPLPNVPVGQEARFEFNYLTTGCNNYGAVGQNCMQDCDPASSPPEQRTPEVCALFCNAPAPQGACLGQGICGPLSGTSNFGCQCNAGFLRNSSDLGQCLPTPSPPPYPPPSSPPNPPPRSPPNPPPRLLPSPPPPMGSCDAGYLSCASNATKDWCCTPQYGRLVLSLQWTPHLGPKNAWSLQGLWPFSCDGAPVGPCNATRAAIIASAAVNANATLRGGMISFWPSARPLKEPRTVTWDKEWAEHGTCLSTLSPACNPGSAPNQDVTEYFAMALALRSQYNVYQALAAKGIVPGKKYPTAAISAAISAAYPGVGVVVVCAGGKVKAVRLALRVQGKSRVVGDPATTVKYQGCTASRLSYPRR